jgi:hypothetical protein
MADSQQQKLTPDQKNILKLIERSPSDESGWRWCSKQIWKLILKMCPQDLTELDCENKRVRFNADGMLIIRYLV